MKLPSLTALLLLAFICGAGAEDNSNVINARTVYHTDGTRTESIRDPSLHEQREFTYDKNSVMISKKIFLLNEKGQTVQGNIYDGRDVLKARAQFLFDELGRMSEERLSTLQGEVYQRIMFSYDAQGNELPPKSQTYNVQAPDMKAAVVDFTNRPAPRSALDRNQGAPVGQGQGAPANLGNVPRLPVPGAAPTAGTQPVPAAGAPQQGPLPPLTTPMGKDEAPKKRSIWQRMFPKDKKDEKK